ncbi:MAG: hypothetical protein AAF722_17025 [Cyanobacteria bacterium P01_C01_bin.70]
MAKRKIKWRQQLRLLSLLIASLVLLYGLGNPPLRSMAEEIGAPVAEAVGVDYETALAELQTSFTFQGEPVNPRAVAALTPWLSDRLPGAIAVDIAGSTANTNQFAANVSVDAAGRVMAEWEQWDDRRFAGYRRIGQLSDGTHVLRTFVNTGGSALFPAVTLINFDRDREIWSDGQLRERLIMMRRGEFILGVGYAGEITVADQTITFAPAPNGDASLTVEIPTHQQ